MRTRLKRLLFNRIAVFGIFLAGSGLLGYQLIGVHAAPPSAQKRIIIRYKLNNAFDNPATSTEESERVSALSAGLATLSTKLTSMNVHITKTYDHLPMIAATADDATIIAVKNLPEVASVEADVMQQAFLYQSGLLLNTASAYTAGYDGTGEYVAILDTGFQLNHVFFGSKIADESCYSGGGVSDPSYPTMCPNGQNTQTGTGASQFCAPAVADCSHGSHVAGIVAGISGTYNLPAPQAIAGAPAVGNKTFSGVAKGAQLITSSVFTKDVASGNITALTSDIIAGMNHVISLAGQAPYQGKIASVNMSLGGGSYTDHASCDAAAPSFANAVATLKSLGIATVIATGNSGDKAGVASPACVTGAIAVGASDKNPGNTVACFSQSATGLVSLLAPGMGNANQITCTGTPPVSLSVTPGATETSLWSAKADPVITNGFVDDQGTSMAAPQVAGAWAVLKQHSPSASVDSLLSIFQNTGVNVTDSISSLVTKRIDVGAAVSSIVAARTWTGGGTTNNWSDAGNWSLGIAPDVNDNVTLDATSTKNITIDVDVNVKSITVAAGYTGIITNNNKNVTTSGSVSFSGTGALALGTGTYTIGGNWSTAGQQSNTTGTPSLVMNHSGAATLATGGEAYSQFSTSGTANVTNSNTLFKVSGNFSIGAGTTFNGSSNMLQVGGNFTNTGTFTAGTSTVVFNGSSQTISGATTFNTLLKTNSATTLIFTSGQTFTVGDIQLSGTSKNAKLNVHASTPASAATIAAAGPKTTTLTYLDMKDMTFSGYASSVNVNNSTDSGNNTGVTFVTAPGVTVTESSGSTAVVKSGATDTYTVELDKAPTAAVNVAITSGSELTASPTTICFDTVASGSCVMWNSPQTVTITAVTPGVAGTHSVNVTYGVTSADMGYNGLSVAPTSVQISDAVVGSTPVTSTVSSATINKPVILTITGSGCNPTISTFTNVKESTYMENTAVDFPLGLNDFTIGTGTCASGFTATVKIALDKVYSDAAKFYKFSGSNSVESTVTDISSSVTFATETVGGKQVTTVTYTVVDGGALDQDGVANGTIVDPAGVGVAQGTTLSALANTGSPIMLNVIIGATIIAIGIYVSTRTHIEHFSLEKGSQNFAMAGAGTPSYGRTNEFSEAVTAEYSSAPAASAAPRLVPIDITRVPAPQKEMSQQAILAERLRHRYQTHTKLIDIV